MKILFICAFSSFLFAEGIDETFDLSTAEEFALKNNKTILAAYDLVEAARSSRSASNLQWIFTIDANAAIKKYEFPIQSPVESRGNYTAGLLLTQNIFNMGLYRENRLAGLALTLAKITLDATMIDTLFAVRETYNKILLDYHIIHTVKHRIELLAQAVENTQKKYDVGETSEFTLNQSKVFLQNSYPPLNRSYRDLKTDLDQFAQILGLNPTDHFIDVPFSEMSIDSIYKIDEKMLLAEQNIEFTKTPYQFTISSLQLNQLFSNEEIQYWIQIAESCRPDYNEAKVNVDIAKQNVKLNVSEFFPLIQGFAELQSPEVDQFNQINLDWVLGVKLNWRLFSGLSRYKRVQASKSQERSTEENLEYAFQTLSVDVQNQVYSIEEAISSYQSAQDSFSLAQVAANQAFERYKVGMISLIDYNQVVDSMIEAELAMYIARFSLIKSYYGLRHASGIDLKTCNLSY